MIIIQLTGGLGNQLFQYSFARSLSYDLNKKLYLDLSHFSFEIGNEHIVYGLHPYNIKGIIGCYSMEKYAHKSDLYEDDINIYEGGSFLTLGGYYYKDRLFDNLNQLKFPAYFTGFYCNGYNNDGIKVMSERFFEHNKKIIKNDLQYMLDLPKEYDEVIEDMNNYDSIALHIRRGDYEKIPRFGTCSVEYYQNAIEKMISELDNPKFFIFSNDYQWFEENIVMPCPYREVDVIDDDLDGVGAGQLLKLMSSCKHFIISNSTFSWWGAWLSNNINKKIIAPSPWFQSRELREVETIDGIKPIHLINNYEKLFKESTNSLFKLENKNDFKEINDFDFVEDGGLFKFNALNHNSNIILNSDDNRKYNYGVIIKFSLKTNSTGFFSFYYKNELGVYVKYNQKMWYYDEEFSHYFILPHYVSIEYLKIQLVNSKNVQVIIKEIEIKELNTLKIY